MLENVANLPKSFGNEAAVSSSSEHDINQKEDLKLSRPNFFPP
jgi:hypothetical protein